MKVYIVNPVLWLCVHRNVESTSMHTQPSYMRYIFVLWLVLLRFFYSFIFTLTSLSKAIIIVIWDQYIYKKTGEICWAMSGVKKDIEWKSIKMRWKEELSIKDYGFLCNGMLFLSVSHQSRFSCWCIMVFISFFIYMFGFFVEVSQHHLFSSDQKFFEDF